MASSAQAFEPADAYATALKSIDNKLAMMILEVPVTSSRVHASRRVFQVLQDLGRTAHTYRWCTRSPSRTRRTRTLILRAGFEAVPCWWMAWAMG